MFGTSNNASSEMKELVKEAQKLFQETSAMSGDKAENLRNRGLKLLDAGIGKAQAVQNYASGAGKKIASSTNEYVRDKPWRAIAISGAVAAGVGLLVGMSVNKNQNREDENLH